MSTTASPRFSRRLIIPAIFTSLGLLQTAYRYLDDRARNLQGTLLPRFIEEMTGVYGALPVIPIVTFITRRVPWRREGLWRPILAHLGGYVVFTLLHTSLMAISRAIIFPTVGLGAYDYGNMIFRFPMEASMDAIAYDIVAAIVFFLQREERLRAAEVATAELETHLARATLENLRLQLHPHFLFNALNAVSSLMYEDVRRADAMLARLSDFLRTVLAAGDVQQVPLADELDVERLYLDVMRARFEQRLQFDVKVAPEAHDAAVPFLVLQPLLENAIRHGVAGERDGIAIAVEVERDGPSTVISVADDGVGLPANGHQSGRGLANVESRLIALFGDAASFAIGPRANGGTLVTLRFPFSAAQAV